MKKIYHILVLTTCLVFIFGSQEAAGLSFRGKGKYDKAIQYIKKAKYDFALIEFRSIIRDFPESRYARTSLFGVAEYFYSQKAYQEAAKNFRAYLKHYPKSDGAIFARVYLLKIIEVTEKSGKGEKTVLEDMKMNFFSQPFLLLFSEYKELSHKTPFRNNFTIRHYMDMVEIHRNGKPFIKITK